MFDIMLVVVKHRADVMTGSGHHSATHAVAGMLLVGGNASTSALAFDTCSVSSHIMLLRHEPQTTDRLIWQCR